MFVLIGVGLVLAATVAGFVMSKGNIAVLIQVNEFIIIAGAGIGSFVAANGLANAKAAIKTVTSLLKPTPYTKQAYLDLLKMMYQLFNVARKEGLLGLEGHIEEPAKSEIIGKYPAFLQNHHASAFFCDTMKVILTGAVGPHDLSEMMELDLDIAHQEERVPVDAVATVGDAMPGFGIVAAVLGVIITMGHMKEGPEVIGEAVAAALVGTFVGVLLGYGVFGPIARAMELRMQGGSQYLNSIRYALFSFARGESPITCVEFARRNIEPSIRPGFTEMEKSVKEKAAA